MRFILLLFCPAVLFSQSALLRPEEALRLALENNFDIRIAQADADIARLNNTKGNAGMLPTVNLVASDNFTLSSFQQQLSNGNEFNALGATFNTFNAGVQLNWPLFDGGRMFIVKDRLEAQEKLGQRNVQAQIQANAAMVLQTYYNIVRSRLQERAIEELITLNEERLRIAEARLAAGFAAQTDALQAQIDLNQQKGNLLLQRRLTTTTKRSLNNLIGRAPDVPFEVVETLDNANLPEKTGWMQKVLANNPTLLALRQNAEVAALTIAENQKLKAPRIAGIGQFNVLRSDNGAGFLKNNTQAGVVVGATFSMPLYTGGNIRRAVEVAKVQAQQAALQIAEQENFLAQSLEDFLTEFETQQAIFQLEDDNVRIARENLSVSTERFRLGQTNALETQIAQNTLEQALFRRNLSLYNLKLAEVNLKALAGEL